MSLSRTVTYVAFLTSVLTLIAIAALSGSVALARQATPISGDAPVPIEFPRDDGPHQSGIEWWYFTGHVLAEDGKDYGFEFVVFRARANASEGYVSHFAITDSARNVFRYDQRIVGSAGVSGDAKALDLNVNGWTMLGERGEFSLRADMPDYAIDLNVTTRKPATFHDGDGYIDYGNGTASYYYSWTRMDIEGYLDLGGGPVPVSGSAWMDHQWGDFATYQDGGWDWFSIQLDDGVDVMLYVVRGPSGETIRVDGSIVGPDGQLTLLRQGDFSVAPIGEWTSPRTGASYPSGWTIDIPVQKLSLILEPRILDQELDTRATTGVIYWEGEVSVQASSHGTTTGGLGYVELTGYAPYEPLDLGAAVASPPSG